MAFFMAFPYTDLYQLNLDWLLETVKRLEQSIGNEVVNTFNTRSGDVELSADDVNALMIESVYIGNPGEDISDISPAELQEIYNAGKRMLLFRDMDGVARELYLLDLVGETATATKYIPDISGDVVTAFNNRSGQVTLLASDVNGTRIDITWVSDPGESLSDLGQADLNEMYASGIRVLIFVNNVGTPDQLYFLSLVNDTVTAQAYIPASAQSGVVSVNGMTGAVTLFGTNIVVRSGILETVDGAVTSIRNNIGDLSALTTDVKTSVVAAINEVDRHADNAASAAATAQTAANNAATSAATAQTAANAAATSAATAQTTANNAGQAAENVSEDVGDISDLETTANTDIVSAINELHNQIIDFGPYNGLDSDSIIAALSAAQGKALNNLITALSTQYNGTIESNNVAYDNTTKVQKTGNLVILAVAFRPNSNISGWSVIGTISAGFRPATALYMINTNASAYLQINADGTIMTSGALTSGTLYRFIPVCYFI